MCKSGAISTKFGAICVLGRPRARIRRPHGRPRRPVGVAVDPVGGSSVARIWPMIGRNQFRPSAGQFWPSPGQVRQGAGGKSLQMWLIAAGVGPSVSKFAHTKPEFGRIWAMLANPGASWANLGRRVRGDTGQFLANVGIWGDADECLGCIWPAQERFRPMLGNSGTSRPTQSGDVWPLPSAARVRANVAHTRRSWASRQ